jgi:hypothetical protein
MAVEDDPVPFADHDAGHVHDVELVGCLRGRAGEKRALREQLPGGPGRRVRTLASRFSRGRFSCGLQHHEQDAPITRNARTVGRLHRHGIRLGFGTAGRRPPLVALRSGWPGAVPPCSHGRRGVRMPGCPTRSSTIYGPAAVPTAGAGVRAARRT